MLDRLRALDTCAVSDALDTLKLPGATTGIRPLWAVTEPVVGRVRAVQAGPRQDGKPAQHIAAAAIEAAETGDVLVIANGGRTDVSCWGGILTLAARRNGVGGVVIDGACRDIAESAAIRSRSFRLRSPAAALNRAKVNPIRRCSCW